MEIIKIMLCEDILNDIITKRKRKQRLPKISGVYKIINTTNNKLYIGSSKDIYYRWKEHVISLNKNKHHSKHLQKSWNKNGVSSFQCEIIEIINKENFLTEQEFDNELRKREQFYLDCYKSYNHTIGYNINKKAEGGSNPYTFEDLRNGKCPFTEEQFFYIIQELKDPYTSIADLARETNISKKIITHIANGDYIELCSNIYIPSRQNLGIEGIEDFILEDYKNGLSLNQINKKYKRNPIVIRGYIKENIEKDEIHSLTKKVYRFSLKGELLKEYNSMKEAIEELKIHSSSLTNCCSNRRRILKNSVWSYSKQPPEMTKLEQLAKEYISELNNPKVVLQYNLDKKLIGILPPSVKFIDINNKKVNRKSIVANAKKNKNELKVTIYGYYWKTANEMTEQELDEILKYCFNLNLLQENACVQ